MASFDEIQKCAIKAIDDQSNLLRKVSEQIWNNPEVAFGEFKAHNLLVETFKDLNFDVTPKFLLPTAFKAEYTCGTNGPTIGVICEYDALPKIGHACGHNLIAICGLGTAVGIKMAMEKKGIAGKLVVFGTPAEESIGGKVLMIEKGGFEGVDVCLMAHGGPINQCFADFIPIEEFTVTFEGRASHASSSPWDGINALDAAVTAYNNISMLRQQMKPKWRVNSVISKGGTVPNIIPAKTEMHCELRTAKESDMKILRKKLKECLRSAAVATGCKYSISKGIGSAGVLNNVKIMNLFKKYAMEVGKVEQMEGPEHEILTASTDMGNVSQIIPSIHPVFAIGTSSALHTTGFAEAAIKDEAHDRTFVTCKALALSALEIMTDDKLLKEIVAEFKNQKLMD